MGRTKRKRRRRISREEQNKNVSTSDPIIRLQQWMKTSDRYLQSCNLQLTEFFPAGLRGLMARRNVNPLDILVQIPLEYLVTKEVAVSFIKKSNLFEKFHDSCDKLTTLELLVIFLLLNKNLETMNLHSSWYWKPYMDTLPGSYEVPYFCTEDEVN